MKCSWCGSTVLLAFAGFGFTIASASAQSVLFDFNNAPLHSPLPLDLTVGGITAHFSATGQGYSIQDTSAPVVPQGFTGRFIYPSSVYAADLWVSFDHTLTDFSILYAPQELACDDSATMRVTATLNGTFVGTNTKVASNPGTWPADTLSCSFPQGFNAVVVHYDKKPPTCTDWGPIFLADDMRVTAAPPPPPPTVHSATPNHGSNASHVAVTISGGNLSGATAVKFGGLPAASFTVIDPATINASTPTTLSAGWIDVSVTTAGGTATLPLGYDAFAPPQDVGAPCSALSLVWSGAPCIGETYTVSTANLGTSKQVLLIDWSDLHPSHTPIFAGSKACSSSPCSLLLQVDQVLFVGSAASHDFPIPANLNLVGLHLGVQSLVRGCPSLTTQALDATIGI